ncbi:MAG: terpene cyclase/mutase family protein [Lachnospiraceae bacterium]|nr:terpene cyclase/mutase family protein [Lachnospiraceae bacterium]
MKKAIKRIIPILMATVIVFTLIPGISKVYAAGKYEGTIDSSCEWLKENSPEPGHGDEWTVFCLARHNAKKYKDYINRYLDAEGEYVAQVDGVLSTYKYTEYAKLAIVLGACGEDPANFKGYDILAPLTDVDAVSLQGLNGCAWALIAMDSVNYEKEGAEDLSETREQYIDILLRNQFQDGGWSMDGVNAYNADFGLTAMIMTALYPYREQPSVTAALEMATNFLSRKQGVNGTFEDEGDNSSESVAQAIVALNSCAMNPESDEFVKEQGFLDALMTYQVNGGFSHEPGGMVNPMATQQATYALISQERAEKGQSALFDFTNSKTADGNNKNTRVIVLSIIAVLIIICIGLFIVIKKCRKKRK